MRRLGLVGFQLKMEIGIHKVDPLNIVGGGPGIFGIEKPEFVSSREYILLLVVVYQLPRIDHIGLQHIDPQVPQSVLIDHCPRFTEWIVDGYSGMVHGEVHFLAAAFVLVQIRNMGGGLDIYFAFGHHKSFGKYHIIRIPVPIDQQQVVARKQEPGLVIGDLETIMQVVGIGVEGGGRRSDLILRETFQILQFAQVRGCPVGVAVDDPVHE